MNCVSDEAERGWYSFWDPIQPGKLQGGDFHSKLDRRVLCTQIVALSVLIITSYPEGWKHPLSRDGPSVPFPEPKEVAFQGQGLDTIQRRCSCLRCHRDPAYAGQKSQKFKLFDGSGNVSHHLNQVKTAKQTRLDFIRLLWKRLNHTASQSDRSRL